MDEQKCAKCGSGLSADAKFCAECGTQVGGSEGFLKAVIALAVLAITMTIFWPKSENRGFARVPTATRPDAYVSTDTSRSQTAPTLGGASGTSGGDSGLNAMCELVLRGGSAEVLQTVSDSQVEKGLCNATKGILEGVSARNSEEEGRCTLASQKLMAEFIRRFPSRDPKSVIGSC